MNFYCHTRTHLDGTDSELCLAHLKSLCDHSRKLKKSYLGAFINELFFFSKNPYLHVKHINILHNKAKYVCNTCANADKRNV